MLTLCYIVFGILLVMVPHFVLPLEFIQGGRDAWVLSECSFWYHPEHLLGMALILAALWRFYSARARYPVALLALLTLAQAIALKPLSFLLRSEENLVIIGQTISLRAHSNIRWFLLFCGSAVALTLLADTLLLRRRRRPLSLLSLSFSNIRRKIFRATSLVLALTVVIGAFFADVLLTRSIGNTLEIGAGRLGADLVVVPSGHEKEAQEVLINGTPSVFNLPPTVYDDLRQWPEVEKASPQLFFRPFSYLVCCTTERVLMVGYDPETDFTIGPWVNYYLHTGQQEEELVVGNRVKFYPGQRISLFGKRLSIVASLDFTGIGYFDRSAFIPLSGARKLISFLRRNQEQAALHERKDTQDLSLAHLFDADELQRSQLDALEIDGISAIFIRATPETEVKKLAKKIETTFPAAKVINIRSATISIKRQMTAMLDSLILPILILIGMGTIILAVIFSMSASERQREVGLLRAMGAKQRDIFHIFFIESLLLTLLGGIFGILGGGALLILFKNKIMAALNLLYIWPGPTIISQVCGLTLAVAIGIGIAAGLYPALKAARLEPYQAIRGK